MSSLRGKQQHCLRTLLIIGTVAIFSSKLYAQVPVSLRQFNGWPVFGCQNVDTQPPPQLQCFQSSDYFGVPQTKCEMVSPPITRQIRCAWNNNGLSYGDYIAVFDECCADPNAIGIYLELSDSLSTWKSLRVGGQTLEATGRGQSFPFTPWLRVGPITVQASDLLGMFLTLSHKNWLGQVNDLYFLDLLQLAHYRGRNVIFQWRWDGGWPDNPPDPFYATPSGAPLDGTILREDNGTNWAVAGEAGFRLPDSATFDRLFSNKVPYFVTNGTPYAALGYAPVDGTLLREENGAVWVTAGKAKFHVPDPPTLTRLYGGQPITQLWDGAVNQLANEPEDGTLLREENGTLWVVVGRAKLQVPDPATYSRLFFPLAPFVIWNGAPDQIPDRPLDGTLLREEDGTVWVIYGNAKFHVPDPPTFARLYADQTPFQLWNGATGGIPTTPVDGTVFRDDDDALWIIYGAAKFELPDVTTHDLLYPGAHIFHLWNSAIQSMPNIPIDNTLLREQDGAIWFIVGQARFQVPDPATYAQFFPNGLPLALWNDAVNSIPTIPLNGTYFREISSSTIYVISGGKRLPTRFVLGTSTIHVLWDGALNQIPLGTLEPVPGHPLH